LTKKGWLVVKHIQTSLNGFPDLSIYKNGVCIFIEVKSEKGVLSEIQKYRHKQLTEKGFKVLIIRNISEILNVN
jgi:Holliday junction resolvase